MDTSRGVWRASNQAISFEHRHHLVNGRWGHFEESLDVGFGWRPAKDACVSMDEGKVFTLLGREVRHDRPDCYFHSQSSLKGIKPKRRHVMNIRYVVSLSESERAELQALVSGGKSPARVNEDENARAFGG